VDNFFCLFFSFEITVRFMAYQRSGDAFKATPRFETGSSSDLGIHSPHGEVFTNRHEGKIWTHFYSVKRGPYQPSNRIEH
jgi:hypothetical protein